MHDKQLFDFEWGVDEAGYELSPEEGGDLPLRQQMFKYKPAMIRGLGGRVRAYRPYDVGLHRVFANIGRDDASIIAFVNQYGLLQSKGQDESVDDFLEALDRVKIIVSEMDTKEFRENGDICGKLFNATFAPPMVVKIDNSNLQKLTISIVPTSLISWIWLLIAQEITEKRHWGKCLNCPEYFAIGKGHSTNRKKYCSDKCKMSWHRKQKEKS